MKDIRKTTSAMLMTAITVLIIGCNNTSSSSNYRRDVERAAESVAQAEAQAEAEAEAEAVVNGNSITYKNHRYSVSGEFNRPGKIPTAFVTFTNIPSDYTEFEAVYTGLLGKSIQGTAAMIPMAIEIYARDAAEGEKCFNLLCNSSSTVSGIIRILKTKLIPSQYAPSNDPYIQRYMAAALLKGAKSTNAYTPEKPYTVEMAASPNGVQKVTGGTVTFIYIIAEGWDTVQRGVEVYQEEGSNLYKVYNCPSCYTQCKNIKGEWPGLD